MIFVENLSKRLISSGWWKEANNDFGKGVAVENNGFEDFVEAKTWNFRPRKPLRKLSNGNNGARHESKAEIRQQLEVSTKSHQVKKEKKQKFSILLTHEEIENDIFIMTGGRPSRRPRKRAKIVQKQLDARFCSFFVISCFYFIGISVFSNVCFTLNRTCFLVRGCQR